MEATYGKVLSDNLGFFAGSVIGDTVANAILGGEQDGALGVAMVFAEWDVLDGHGKKASEAEGLDLWGGVFEGTAEDFGADVDAEDGLDGGAGEI